VLLQVLPSITPGAIIWQCRLGFYVGIIHSPAQGPRPLPATAPQLWRHTPHAFIAKILHNLLARL